MHPILALKPLAGMTYPRLESADLVRVVAGPDEIETLPRSERSDVRVLMTSASRGCSRAMVNALPNLGLVVSHGAGSDKIDSLALKERGIGLRCVGEAATDDVADLAMTLTQMVFRDLVRADAFARSGAWETRRFELGESLVGKTMGVAGLSGRIGKAIAARARVSRMTVASLDRPSNRNLGARLYPGWTELAEGSDVLVLAVPAARDLHHVVNADVLKALGPKGILVNVGRGSLVDSDALVEALETGRVAGAALDVLETEPKIPERLAALPNVVLTPHIGAQTWGHRARAAQIAEQEVLAYVTGQPSALKDGMR